MATYAGYQAVSAPDLSAPFREQLAGLMSKRAADAERQFQLDRENLKLKKAEMDKVDAGYYDAQSKIMAASVTDYPNKTFKDLIFDGANSARDYLKSAHDMVASGDMSINQYKQIESNMLASFTALNQYQSNAAEFANDQVKRQAEGKSGYLEEERTMYNAQLSNLQNKTATILPDGNLVWQTLDENGEVVNTQSVINLVSANNISNQFVDKMDLSAMVDGIAQSQGGYTYTKGLKTISDPTAQEGYTGWVNSQIRMVTNGRNPQTITSILMDGGVTDTFELKDGVTINVGGGTYRTQEELSNKVDQQMLQISEDYEIEFTEEEAEKMRAEIESMMIPITTEGGKDVYGVSSKHINLVENRLKDDIKMKLGYKESKKSPTSSGKPTQTQLISDKVRELSDKAWNQQTQDAFGNLDKNYVYIPSDDGESIKIYNAMSIQGIKVKDPKQYKDLDPVTTAYGPEDLADYAESIATAQIRYQYGQTVSEGELDNP